MMWCGLYRLAVPPLNGWDIWHGRDPEAARDAMPPPAAPDEGVLVRVPVIRGAPDGLLDLGPSLKTPPFEGQGAQCLPPRLHQVEVGRVDRLEHELPARMGQRKQKHVGGAVGVE